MSKILNLVEKHFGDGEPFTHRDFSFVTNINEKVCAMQLSRLSHSERIGRWSNSNGSQYVEFKYFYRTLDEANEAVKERNEILDKNKSRLSRLKQHVK